MDAITGANIQDTPTPTEPIIKPDKAPSETKRGHSFAEFVRGRASAGGAEATTRLEGLPPSSLALP